MSAFVSNSGRARVYEDVRGVETHIHQYCTDYICQHCGKKDRVNFYEPVKMSRRMAVERFRYAQMVDHALGCSARLAAIEKPAAANDNASKEAAA